MCFYFYDFFEEINFFFLLVIHRVSLTSHTQATNQPPSQITDDGLCCGCNVVCIKKI